MSHPKLSVFTIGHSNHPAEVFLRLLLQHGIEEIVDVRSSPHSRYNPQFNRKALQAVLAEAGVGYVFMGAELGGRPVGQLMITTEWSDWRNAHFWWLQSVYVVPECRRQGVFRSLYNHVVRQAQEAGNVCGLRLYVERTNQRAQQVYADLGMAQSHYDMFEVEF